MKYFNGIFLILIILALSAFAGDDVRTLETKAVDLVAKFPAQSSSERDMIASEIIELGPEGITLICGMLTPSGKGDDTKVRFALNSLTMYVCRAEAGKERETYSKTLIKALDSDAADEVKAFIISQLQLVSKKEAVNPLRQYLKHDYLCEPAARALVAIGTSDAEKALLKSLSSAKGKNLVTIVNALGQIRSQGAAKKIAKYATSADLNLRQVTLGALANIGNPVSAEILGIMPLASTSFERTTAASRYILYAERLNENGHKELGAAICRSLRENYTAPHESGIQCAALTALVSISGGSAFNDLLAAVDNENKDVRNQALVLAEKIKGPEATSAWLEKMAAADAEKKAEIIAMLGDRGDVSALPPILEALKDEDENVRLAAIPAAAKLGRSGVIPNLLPILKENNLHEVAAVKSVFLWIEPAPVIEASAEALPDMPTLARVALMEVLAERRAKAHANLVFDQTKCKNDTVRLAAITALQNVVTENDLPRLLDLLLTANDSTETARAQDAAVSAALQISEKEKRADLMLEKLKQVPAEKRPRLILPLSRLGGEDALAVVIEETMSKNSKNSEAAIRTLANWPDFAATTELIHIIRTTKNAELRTLATGGCVRLVNHAEISFDEKLKMLVDALEGSGDKGIVLQGLAEVPTKESLNRVAEFLHDSTLSNQAALAAEKIALPRPDGAGLRGAGVVSTLKRAASVIESGYERERIEKYVREILEKDGFVPLFNGKDLSGWKGLVENPKTRAEMSPEELAKKQVEADSLMREHWRVVDGILDFDGKGHSLCTAKDYTDFEMFVDWKIGKHGDSGIYLRGTPQVQIWDPAQWPEGSGGLYNNQKNPRKPLQCADNPIGEWNTFRIKMIDDRVTVHLNDVLVVDNVVMENYWERDKPIYRSGQIELQAHNSQLYFREIYIREILPEGRTTGLTDEEKADGFVQLFNGKDLTGWVGDTTGYTAKDGKIVIYPDKGGNLYTAEEYDNFIFRFEFKLTPGANNGLGIRAPLQGDAAYVGMELQILDNTALIYRNLQPYQYHGSIYGVVPAKRGFLNPVGEWNREEVIADSRRITVKLNGTTIVDADIDEASKNGTLDNRNHPGLKRTSGHIGFLGHGSYLEFRNIRIKELK